MLDAVVILVAAAIFYVTYRAYNSARRGRKVGNIELATTHFWTAHQQMHKIYGDIVSVSMLGTPFIIMNIRKLVVELEKRHQNYTERPKFPMIQELVGWNR
ncbi:hypothetical protein EUX98_g2366 [Antrodiella citrinella]|uniref:Cytochrome P450 n=1 Tax=Antrodiella citrinella TaxID=2447956 RepID=A0A4S4MZ69_9APHY|nr:hypothetical protein EUX98_g2366 [Antrodiella citrinella]